MKITIDVTPLIRGVNTGTSKYTFYLTKTLLKKTNLEINLFSFCPIKLTKQFKRKLNSYFPHVEKTIIPFPQLLTNIMLKCWQKFEYPPIDKLIKHSDIFHSMGLFQPPLKKTLGVSSIHDLTFLTNPEWHNYENKKLHTLRVEKINKNVKFIVANSQNTKNKIRKVLDFDGEIIVVYPGVDRKIYKKHSTSRKKKIKKKYKIHKDFFISISDFNPRKNTKTLIKSFTEFNKINNKFNLVIVTNNKEIPNIKNDNIIILKNIKEIDLGVLYNSSTCLIYPSLFEGFGMPIIEAFEAHTPVITSRNAGGINEAAGNAAIKIDPNKNELIKAMNYILDPETRNKLIENGLRQAKKFSWSKSSKVLSTFYKKIIK
jgi:glycosyltransferase involved in cell wall biosynthesis